MRARGSAYCFDMPRPPKVVPMTKVVPITQPTPKLIAEDEQTKRLIIAIGRQRIAFDMTTRITHLPPNTGDHPGVVLPLQAREPDPGNRPLAGTPKRRGPRAGSRGKRRGDRMMFNLTDNVCAADCCELTGLLLIFCWPLGSG